MELIAQGSYKCKSKSEFIDYINKNVPSGIHNYISYIQEMERAYKETRKKSRSYLVTFTIDPKKHMNNPVTEERAQALVYQQATRAGLQLQQFVVSKEYQESGYPHWHVLVRTTLPKGLSADRFVAYKRKFGHVDIEITKNKSQQVGDILEYIEKDNDALVLV